MTTPHQVVLAGVLYHFHSVYIISILFNYTFKNKKNYRLPSLKRIALHALRGDLDLQIKQVVRKTLPGVYQLINISNLNHSAVRDLLENALLHVKYIVYHFNET